MVAYRPSTLKERYKFYSKEFKPPKVYSFFQVKPKYFAVDFGTETRITKNPKKHNTLIYFKTKDLRKKLLSFLPEDVYYDRNLHRGNKFCSFCLKTKYFFKCKNFLGQELIFDVDADNFKCSCKKVCNKCISKAIDSAFKLAKKLPFKDIKIVYSGRGCHVHVFDKKAYKLTENQRKALARKFKKYGIDIWVTEGKIRLVRLPYSLNALVSRIVTPVRSRKFNFKEAVPKFV